VGPRVVKRNGGWALELSSVMVGGPSS